jgi:hypothetical protein
VIEAAPTAGRYAPTAPGRAGLLVAALGGLVAAVAPLGDLTSGASASYHFGGGFGAIGVIAAILLTLAALLPWLWARIAGLALAVLFAAIYGAVVISGRTGDVYPSGVHVRLDSGGVLLVVAFALTMIGLVLALVGLRRPAPAGSRPDEPPGTVGKAVAALILGICGLLVPICAALAVGFALLARDDARASGGVRTGEGMAIAGLALGIVALVAWGLGIAVAMGTAQP